MCKEDRRALLLSANPFISSAGRIFEFVHTRAVVNQETLPQIVGVLLGSIRDMPHIAEKVCYAMAQLAAGFKDDNSTSLFSPYFKEIVGALLDAVRCGHPPNPPAIILAGQKVHLKWNVLHQYLHRDPLNDLVSGQAL